MSIPVEDGVRSRVVIEEVTPEVNSGRYPVKRVIGERVVVEADIYADGHDRLGARLLWRRQGEGEWQSAPLEPLNNDRRRGEFPVVAVGCYEYTIEGWIDEFETWRADLEKRIAAGQELSVELLIGAGIVRAAAERAGGEEGAMLHVFAASLRNAGVSPAEHIETALGNELSELISRHPDLERATRYGQTLAVWVDRPRARFSAWYEMFPRSASVEPGRHGTFRDVEARLPYLAELGFDILYFPPIHPIGTTFRKGPNNTLTASPGDPGCPWGIGSAEGGHQAIHHELGTLDDFKRLTLKAREFDIEIALDIALQCSPDHPYLTEHPEWFRRRPDGAIQYAENPPKKYQDIYPFDFENPDWQSLWMEIKSIFDYWIQQGVTIFRVDNPHTKPFRFWEWLIGEIKSEHPNVLFLSESFTRPKVMHRLAKVGFTQSYTYFTWRTNKWELEQYLTELSQHPSREYFIPSLWPNTPDILHEYLTTGGRPAFIARLVMAATAAANYGIYGPAFELCLNTPREKGSEEYLYSEKYEIKLWNVDDPASIRGIVAAVNRARRDNPALQSDWSLRFHPIDNPFLLCYSKQTDDLSNVVLIAVNLDPFNTQIGWVDLPLEEFGLGWDEPYQVHDLLTDERYTWHGGRNYIELNPHKMPAHIFRLRRRVPGESGVDESE